MEAVACYRILALQELGPTHLRHDNDGASSLSVASKRTAPQMALASPNVRVAHHVACVSC
jgi:hypothetical protein